MDNLKDERIDILTRLNGAFEKKIKCLEETVELHIKRTVNLEETIELYKQKETRYEGIIASLEGQAIL